MHRARGFDQTLCVVALQGHIVTNFHVIRGASNIKVALIDSSVYPARVRLQMHFRVNLLRVASLLRVLLIRVSRVAGGAEFRLVPHVP